MAEVTDKTFSQSDVDAAVAAAVAPLQAKLTEIEAVKADSDTEARIAAAVEPIQTQVAELQAKLDEAEVGRQAEKDRADGIVAWLDGEKAAQADAAEFEARKTARVEQAKEVAGLTDEYLADGDPASNADRFAAMSEEAWQVTVDGWAAQRASAGAPPPAFDGPPKRTAMVAAAAGAAEKSAMSEVAEARIARTVNLATLNTSR